MENVTADQVKIFQNSPGCTVREYETKNKDINIAVVTISGRYPTSGWAMNEKCTMMAFILKGKGSLFIEDRAVGLSENDGALILPGEKYAWEGEMTILLPATPAWYPEQYKVLSE